MLYYVFGFGKIWRLIAIYKSLVPNLSEVQKGRVRDLHSTIGERVFVINL